MSTSNIYEQYFGLQEHPFSINPDPRFVYLSESHRAALDHLKQGAVGGANGFVLLTGDVGTGKTTICRTFLEQVPPKTEVALILNPVLTLNEFLQTICDELDLVIEGSRESNKNLIDQLNRFLLQVYAVGQKTVLIVDEAQNLTHELLEQIRLLTNLETNTDKLLQIFLIGQPELRDMLNRPDMLQVSQRITSRYHLGPLNKVETREYILKRLDVAGTQSIDFTSAGIRRIYAFSKGVPRLINVLCDKALLSAYESSTHKIGGKIVRDAERRVSGNMESTRGGWLKAGASFGVAAFLAALILGAGYWMNVANMRSWIEGRLVEVPGVESASPDVPRTRSLAETAPPPLPDSPPPAKLSETAERMPSQDTRSSVEGGEQGGSNQVASAAGISTTISPDGSSDPPELPNEASSPPLQPDLAQADHLAGTEGVESAEIELAATSQSLTVTTQIELVPETESLESPEIERAITQQDQTGTAQSDPVAPAEDIEAVKIERAPVPQSLTDTVQDDRAPGTEDLRVPEIERAATPQDREGTAQGDLVARAEPIEPLEFERPPTPQGSAYTEQGEPKVGNANTRKRADSETDRARPSTTTRSRAARPAQTLTGYTQKFAERKLLSMWGVTDEQPAGLDFCLGARRQGLNCLTEESGLSGLYLYNRPAMISLTIAEVSSYAVVTKATPENVVLNVLGREHVIPANVLPTVWDGSFLLLWRGSDDFAGNLAQGATGRPAVWLRRTIDQIEGKETTGDVYDAPLVARVKQFQSDVGLTPDGIVGPRTHMVLQNKLAELEKN